MSSSVKEFFQRFDECQFEQIPPIFYETYKKRSRPSSEYFAPEYQSSYQHSLENVISCKKFRRKDLIGTPEEIKVFEWNISASSLDTILKKNLFHDSQERFDSFLDETSRNVEKFRTFFYQLAFLDGSGIRKIDEVSYFQPLFHLFLSDMLSKLVQSTSNSSTNNLENFGCVSSSSYEVGMHSFIPVENF